MSDGREDNMIGKGALFYKMWLESENRIEKLKSLGCSQIITTPPVFIKRVNIGLGDGRVACILGLRVHG